MATPAPTAMRHAYAHVKDALLDGTYEEGDLLSESAIAAELGVSRTPVREACLQLEAEGLLRLYPKRGALVVGLSARDVRELLDVREVVEAACLRRVDGRALAPSLREHLDGQRAAAATGDAAAFAAADRALHRAWVAAAGNALLVELFDGLRDRSHRIALRVVGAGPEQAEALVAEHEAVVRALAAGDGEGAATALAAHLRGAARRIAGG